MSVLQLETVLLCQSFFTQEPVEKQPLSVREDRGVRGGEDLPGVECEGDVRRQQEHL